MAEEQNQEAQGEDGQEAPDRGRAEAGSRGRGVAAAGSRGRGVAEAGSRGRGVAKAGSRGRGDAEAGSAEAAQAAEAGSPGRGGASWRLGRTRPTRRALKSDYNERIVPAMIEKFGEKNRLQCRGSRRSSSPWASARRPRTRRCSRLPPPRGADRGPEAGEHQGQEVGRPFQIREGMPIGVKVTLRGHRMFEFLDRLVTLALPRVRTFAASTRARSTAAAITRWA